MAFLLKYSYLTRPSNFKCKPQEISQTDRRGMYEIGTLAHITLVRDTLVHGTLTHGTLVHGTLVHRHIST